MTTNLLRNPSGEDQLGFWELTENGGDEWKVEDFPGDCGHKFGIEGVSKYFATSFHLCVKRQVVDLLEEGYSPVQLDAQPTVTVGDWYSGRTDCGCTYQITVRLLDENKDVLQEFKPDLVTLDPDYDDGSWKQVNHTFSEFGRGLRFISFEHGGQDTKFWDGWYGVRVTGSSITIRAPPVSATNLLRNPSGEDQLGFWELTENGGDEWKVEDFPGDCGHKFGIEGVSKYFATSFGLCLKRQVVDLLEEGYSPEQLDAQPTVTVGDWYSGRTDCGCTYQITVRLLDENKDVLQEFKPDLVTLDPDCDDVSWKQVNHTFSELGRGLRFISFEHGGQDTKFWDGWYGVRVTGSSVTIRAPPVSATNLLRNPSGEDQLGFWELTENGGDEWKVEDFPGDCGHKFGIEGVSKYFATSFHLCLKRQVVDLLEEGYSPEQLDAQPTVTVGDWYSGRTDCGCTYQITVRLLDENKDVLQEFKPDLVTLDPDCDDVSWKQVNHTFSEFGRGLRFISFEHGGQDTKFWDGWYGVRVTGSSITIRAPPVSATNLLRNPSGEDQLGFWELTENGGDEWKVEDFPGDCGHKFGIEGVSKYFATSFHLCLKRQVVDLLEEGYSPEQLDAQPTVTVGDWYSGRTDCGCTYQITVRLLDENKDVLQEFKPDLVTLEPDCDDGSWKQVNHTFSEFGRGLRFISFEHGGQDTKFWDGWYGVRVTGSSITIRAPPVSATNLLRNPSGEDQLGFWELTENGGDGWKVEDFPGDCGHKFGIEGVSKYFATSFHLCLKRQVVDLLEEGYSPEQLDAQPTVTVGDWYSGRTDCGCTYQITVRLLDENKDVLQEFKPDLVTLDPDCDDVSWKQVNHTFSEFGRGLRFISFEHGGQDTKFWDGWYGVRVTGSSVTVKVCERDGREERKKGEGEGSREGDIDGRERKKGGKGEGKRGEGDGRRRREGDRCVERSKDSLCCWVCVMAPGFF